MKNYFCLLCVLLLMPVLVCARGHKTYKQVESLYSNVKWLSINKVEFNDTSTIVDITAHGKINGDFHISKDIHLNGEDGKIYGIKKVENVKLEDKNYIGRDGTHSFSLYFDPLAKDTKAFDLLEGWADNEIRVLGIYNKKKGLKFLDAKDEIDVKEVAIDNFIEGKTCIKGRIENYSSENEGETLVFHNNKYEGFISGQKHYKYNRCKIEISPSGIFCADINLDHPLWTKLVLEKSKKEIPIYVRPGDTLDITIRNCQSEELEVQYVSSNPKGCCENLMKHCNVPMIFAQWNEVTNFGQNIDYGHFVSEICECTERNMLLCDYFAWKHRLTPWEHHLLKNRQLLDLTVEHLFIASKSIKEVLTLPQGREARKEDYTGYDFSIYDILRLLPSDDPSLCYILNNVYFPRSLNLLYPIGFVRTYAFINNPNSNLDKYREETKVQIETIKELVGQDKSAAWMIDAFLVFKILDMPYTLSKEEKNAYMNYLLSLMTVPYYKNRLQKLVSFVN